MPSSLIVSKMPTPHSLVLLLASFVLFPGIATQFRDQIPQKAPQNLTLLDIKGKQATIQWDVVDVDDVRGIFLGYLVRTWNHVGSQVYAFQPDETKVSVEFFPHSKNFITVSVRNEKYVGPPSDAISFDAPQIEPNLPYVLEVNQLSNDSILLHWSKPTQPNGILTGYKVYCYELDEDNFDMEILQISHSIPDPEKLQVKIAGLNESSKYRVGVAAINCAGESEQKTQNIKIASHELAEPFVPSFTYIIDYKPFNAKENCGQPPSVNIFGTSTEDPSEMKLIEVRTNAPLPARRCLVDTQIIWVPDVKNNPGEHFYVRYRVRGEEEYQVTEPELNEDFVLLKGFDACKNYEIILTAVDGDFSTDSEMVVTPTKILYY